MTFMLAEKCTSLYLCKHIVLTVCHDQMTLSMPQSHFIHWSVSLWPSGSSVNWLHHATTLDNGSVWINTAASQARESRFEQLQETSCAKKVWRILSLGADKFVILLLANVLCLSQVATDYATCSWRLMLGLNISLTHIWWAYKTDVSRQRLFSKYFMLTLFCCKASQVCSILKGTQTLKHPPSLKSQPHSTI